MGTSFLYFMACFLYLACGCGSALSQGKDSDANAGPLPELNDFLSSVKGNLRGDRLLQSQYTYNRKTTTRLFDKEGRLRKVETREFEVYPSLEEEMTYERLIAEDGRPLAEDKLREQDRKYQKKVEERARKLASQNKREEEERRAREAEEARKEQKTIDELFALYEFALLSRELIDGHSALRVSFKPRPNYRPKTKDAQILKKVRGEALVSETDYQVMQVDVELIEDFSVGLGMLARVHKGTRLKFIRRKVNEEVWLPAEFHFTGSARAFLLRQLRIESYSSFSDYRRFSVSSTYELLGQRPPR